MDTHDTEIRTIDFQEVQSPQYYTVKDLSIKLNQNPVKINHLIFKLNKMQGNRLFFSNTEKFTEEDCEKMELALALIDDGKTYDEVIEYFLNEDNGMIDITKETSQEIISLQSQRMTKEVVLALKKEFNNAQQEIINSISVNFSEETKKIAQISLEAMSKTKEHILEKVDELSDKNDDLIQQNNQLVEQNKELKDVMQELINQNTVFKDEIERHYSKEAHNLQMKLKKNDEELKKVASELQTEKTKNIWSKLFKK